MWKRFALIVSLLVATSCHGSDTDPDATAVEPDDTSDSRAQDTRDERDTIATEDTDAVNDTESDSSMQGVGGVPNPRWVLYDGDENAVNAIINLARLEPSPYSVEAGTFFDPSDSDEIGGSVRIRALDEDPLPAATYLDLKTGKVRGRDLDRIYYLDQNCRGERYVQTQGLALYGGQDQTPLLWPKGEIKEVNRNELYDISRRDGRCNSSAGDSTINIVPLKKAPDSIRNAFSNPPYEVKPRY